MSTHAVLALMCLSFFTVVVLYTLPCWKPKNKHRRGVLPAPSPRCQRNSTEACP